MGQLTENVKHLIILNVILFFATMTGMGDKLFELLALYSYDSPLFKPWQLVTHMFMHGGMSHILFNMFALYMFGSALEQAWGGKRFLIFYFATGIGGAALYLVIKHFQLMTGLEGLPAETLELLRTQGADAILQGKNFTDPQLANLNGLMNGAMVGASGAISGLLMAFAFIFPNAELMLMFFPVPIKAKYFIPLIIAYELYAGVANTAGDNVAHYAHISGMVIGFIIMKVWGGQFKHQRWN
jgi:membrane associated rhomboid family serine protease